MAPEPASRDRVLAALGGIVDPARNTDIVSAGMVAGLTVAGGAVSFAIEVEPERGAALEPLRRAAEQAVLSVPGITSATVVLTAHAAPGGAATVPPPADRPPPDLRGPGHASPPRSPQSPPGQPLQRPARQTGRIDGVGRILAIGSGKGGVGKSTVAANLAVALTRMGRRVGLLDADVYGPSQPRMLGVSGRPSTPDGKTILPLRNHGVTVMSMGFMLEADQSVVWRGPMLMSAVQQMLHQVRWGQLDDLLVDLPPGTGDVQLTLCQKTEVSGAIIVSTPQDVALLDARKALDMFRKLDTPVLGIIENMSGYVCPNCGHSAAIFGHGGARREAASVGVPFLGEIPLDIDIRRTSDDGTPLVAARPDSPQSGRFANIARRLTEVA